MFSTPDFYLTKEIVPEQWRANRMLLTSSVTGRSTYPTPAHVLATLQHTERPADFEIHVRGDAMTAPVQVRCALLKLRDAGFGRARHLYELTADQFSRIGLSKDDVEALTITTPFFGTPAAPVLELVGKDEIALELAIAVLGG